MTIIMHSLALIIGVALFQPPALAEIAGAPILALVCIPLAAGLCEMTGQSFVLLWRRVRLAQALASFALTGLAHLGGVSVWTGAALLVLHLDHVAHVSPSLVFSIVSVCYAPRLLSILTIAPYYGELLGRALDGWTMACVGWGLYVAAGASLPAAMICASTGWLVSHGVRHFGGNLTAPMLNRLAMAGAADV